MTVNEQRETGELERAAFAAARRDDLSGVADALAHGLAVNTTNEHEASLLLVASEHNHAEMARFLLESGADTELLDERGMTAMMAAACHGHLEVVALLLAYKASLETRSHDGRNALMFAAMFDRIEVVMFLLEQGANPGDVDWEGNTPLRLAQNKGASRASILLRQ